MTLMDGDGILSANICVSSYSLRVNRQVKCFFLQILIIENFSTHGIRESASVHNSLKSFYTLGRTFYLF